MTDMLPDMPDLPEFDEDELSPEIRAAVEADLAAVAAELAAERGENAQPAPEPETTTQSVELPLTIYLASASPRRKELLGQAGVKFTVRVPVDPVDEELTPEQMEDPYNAVKTLAERKAAALVQELLAEEVVGVFVIIGADTMVVKGTRVFGKPTGAGDATDMLRALSGCTHQVMTGVAVWMIVAPAPGQVSVGFRSWTDESQVTFRTIQDDEIAEYLRLGESFDKAGAYAIQGEGRRFVRSVQGAMDTVIGLPVEHLLQEFPDLVQDGE